MRRLSLKARRCAATVLPALLSIAALAGLPSIALAAGSPFGIATPDSPMGNGVSGPFAPVLMLAIEWQTYFYKALTGALDQFTSGGNAALWLVGLSFVYGILHAVGPGHGKAVMSSYVMATGDALKEVVALSVAASVLQAVSAIIIIFVAVSILDATATQITTMTDHVELISYGLITLLGIALFASRMRPLFASWSARPASVGSFACEGFEGEELINAGRGRMAHALGHPEGCDCLERIGQLYATRRPATLRERLATVASVGVRPCSGALIVLVFALARGLAWPGILSVFAMAAGTALTVSLVALASVFARGLLARLAGEGTQRGARLSSLVQVLGAAVVLVFGVTMEVGALASAGWI